MSDRPHKLPVIGASRGSGHSHDHSLGDRPHDHPHDHPHSHPHSHPHDPTPLGDQDIENEALEPLVSRRSFIELMGAGLAAGGLIACEPPRGPIFPYSRQPRAVTPGKPKLYATSIIERGYASGLLATSWEGRPTKVDGNPDHPATLGGGSWMSQQASIMDLYDPSRGKLFRRGKGRGSWGLFLGECRTRLSLGAGLHILMEPTSSPSIIGLIRDVRQRFPEATFHFYDPLDSPAELAAATEALGRPALTHYHFDQAQIIASFDADFLADPPFRVRYAGDFAKNRRVRSAEDGMSRLYVAEGELSLVGALADHRLRTKPSEIPSLLLALLAEVARGQQQLTSPGAQPFGPLLSGLASSPRGPNWIQALAKDLLSKQGAGLVVVGPRQPKEALLLGHVLNAVLGNTGHTITYTDPVLFEAGQPSHDLGQLTDALAKGSVQTLIILDVDPVYDSFPELGFDRLLEEPKVRIYSGLWENQTSRRCQWFLPGLHYLERWGDGRAYDGTLSLIQPLIHPLYGGRSTAEVLAALTGEDPNPDDRALLRSHYLDVDDPTWNRALQHGFFRGALPKLQETVAPDAASGALQTIAARAKTPGIELSLRPDLKLGGGAQGSNDWLIELPDPVTRLAWGNAALLSPSTSRALGLRQGEVIEVGQRGGTIQLPVLTVEGMADEVISIALGWGNPAHERDVSQGLVHTSTQPVGVNSYPLRTRAAPWIVPEATVRRLSSQAFPLMGPQPEREQLAIVQTNLDMHDRPILLGTTLEAFRQNPNFVEPHNDPAPDLYGTPWTYSGQQWGMSIDLNTCIGCNACVVACQAENNTPTVGKTNAFKGRSMHWLRIDRYLIGDSEDTMRLLPQPMMCQHCEKAPCEYVCPVNATVHSPDGLNEMVYNRCIGTRFCSNNCPYKVRRFNYLRYNDPGMPETLKMQKNPDVSVRGRGVMEKCTYCVQRIRSAEIDARIEERKIRIGEVKTACQVACPTQAIVFGLVSEPDSPVSQLHALSRSYGVLQHDLGTEPRTRYLANLSNPNPELES